MRLEQRNAAGDDAGDNALRDRFSRLRGERETRVVPFATTVATARSRAAARPATSRSSGIFAALALAVPMLIALLSYTHARAAEAREQLALAREISALVEWQSPTASLLEDGYMPLLNTTPALHASNIRPRTSNDGGM